MKFNIKKFKNNILFFLICIASLAVLLVISLFTNKSTTLNEEDLNNDTSNVSKLIINEVMSSNGGTITDSKGKIYDYIELYNGSDSDINLKNYGLSDSNKEIKYTFSEVIIKSKGYLIVFLSGTTEELHAPFKLKASGGETIGLFKPNGKVTDAVDTVALNKDTVMARNSDGKWVIQTSPTPGFANTIDGHKEFVKSLKSSGESGLIINEVLPNNKGQFKTKLYNEYSGYIEIKNTSDESINVENYSLSNSNNVIYKWQLPNITLKSDQVLVVFTSNRNIVEGEELHASFKLTNNNGIVTLSDNKGKMLDSVEYENLANGFAYIKEGDNFLTSNIISPGFNNDVDGINDFEKKYMTTPEELIINEVMNKNYEYLAQNGGEYYDWIELYNNTNKTIKLSDYCLTTNLDSICMYKLPDVELKSKSYYVIMASGEESLSNNSYKHTNFNLSEVQALYITKSTKTVDSIFVANIPSGYSMGRKGSSGIYYFNKPTPNKENGSGTEAISYAPVASVKSGTYNNSKGLNVELIGSSKIYYTTDGSTPTTKSKVYSSPLEIQKTTVLKTMSDESGKIKSDINVYSYIINEGHSLPVISVTIDPTDLKNLHSHAWTEGYIKPCNAELIELDGSGFQIGAGLKLFGGSTRGHAKKSYELKFKKEYGEANLHYQVFDTIDSSVFNSLVLRTGSQDEMGSASKKTLIRDLVGTSLLAEHTSVDVQAYKTVAMYLNGKYWGLYFIREKIDETIVSNHYNVPVSKTDTTVLRIDNQLKSGSRTKYNQMISFIKNNSMSNASNYEKIKEQINIENFCDFWIAETWTANNDIVNVRFFSNPNVDNGRWHFILYDLDFAFYNVNRNYYQFSTSASGMTPSGYSTLILRSLMKNSEFKKTYLERLSYNLKNTWSEENVLKKIDDIINEIGEDEIKRNLDRWNMSYDTWKSSVEFLRSYAKKRGDYMISQAKSFFSLSSSEANKYFGDI